MVNVRVDYTVSHLRLRHRCRRPDDWRQWHRRDSLWPRIIGMRAARQTVSPSLKECAHILLSPPIARVKIWNVQVVGEMFFFARRNESSEDRHLHAPCAALYIHKR